MLEEHTNLCWLSGAIEMKTSMQLITVPDRRIKATWRHQRQTCLNLLWQTGSSNTMTSCITSRGQPDQRLRTMILIMINCCAQNTKSRSSWFDTEWMSEVSDGGKRKQTPFGSDSSGWLKCLLDQNLLLIDSLTRSCVFNAVYLKVLYAMLFIIDTASQYSAWVAYLTCGDDSCLSIS